MEKSTWLLLCCVMFRKCAAEKPELVKMVATVTRECCRDAPGLDKGTQQ